MRNNRSSEGWSSHIVELFTQRFLTLVRLTLLTSLLTEGSRGTAALMATATLSAEGRWGTCCRRCRW